MSTLDQINRTVTCEVLPDLRLRVTRRYDISDGKATMGNGDQFDANVKLPWGTEDEDYDGLRLIKQDVTGQTQNDYKKPNDPPAFLIRIFEQIDEENETPVGGTDITYDQYNNKIVTLTWIQFQTGALDNQEIGIATAPAPNEGAVLKEQIETEDGTLRTIKRVYTTGGTMSDIQELRFSGKVVIRTITSLNQIPATPSGFSLVGPGVTYPRGLPLYEYQFAAATGGGSGSGTYIGQDTEYIQSPDQGTTGVTKITTTAVVAEGGANPVTSPGAGYQLIEFKYDDDAGFRRWVVVYAKGQGLVESNIDYKNKGMLVVYTKTSLNTAPTAPSATIGGTVVLIGTNVENGMQLRDGVVIYRYQWAEGNGIISTETRGEPDGAIVKTIVELTATATTPATPGTGWYLVSLEQRAADGHYVNQAVYKKPPVTQTFKKRHNFTKPGRAYFDISPDAFILQPPTDMVLLADYEVSYAESQISDAPFTLEAAGSLNENFIPTDTGAPQANQRGLGGYLAQASSVSGSGGTTYNGILMDEYSAVLISSIPSTWPGGTLVIDTDNDPYLTAVDGTVVFRRTKVSYTF